MSALQLVANPNIAYLLFLLGLVGLVAELYHPGTIAPGTLGAVALLLAFVGFATLPVSWAGVLLIVLAVGMFIAELHTGVGALAALAVVALIAGSLFLYGPPSVPSAGGVTVRVDTWLVATMSAIVTAFFLLIVRATLRARHLAVRTGVAALVGQPGVVLTELSPTGTVRVESEVWTAVSDGGPIHTGEHVKVVGAAGVTLQVARAT